MSPFVNEQHTVLTSPGSRPRPTFEELLRELRRATRKYHQKPQLSASHRIVSIVTTSQNRRRILLRTLIDDSSSDNLSASFNYQAYMISCVAYVLMMLRFYASISPVQYYSQRESINSIGNL